MGTPSWIIPANKVAPTTPNMSSGKTPSWIIPAKKAAPVTPAAPKLGTYGTSQIDLTDAGGGDAKYRNIFDVGSRYTPNITSGDNANVHYDKPMLDDWSTWQPEEENLKGIVSARMEQAGGEGFDQGGGLKFDIDYSKLPNGGKTSQGHNLYDIIPIRGQNDLKDLSNKDAIYYDPNYGWVTHRSNKKTPWDEKVFGTAVQMGAMGMLGMAGGAVLGGAMGGMGNFAGSLGSAFGKAIPSTMQGMLNGQKPGLGTLAGIAGQAAGLPSWVIPAGKTAYQLSQYGKGG